MKWIDVAYLTVFVGTFIFMAGAAALLYKIMGATQQAKLYQLDALSETSTAAKELHLVAKQLARQIERSAALGLLPPQASEVPATPDVDNADLTQRLRDKLKDVLTQNMKLKGELERSKAGLSKMGDSSRDIHTGLGEVKGVDARDAALVKDLTRMTEGLQLDLEEARRRAQAAEKLAYANAEKLEDMREAMSVKSFSESAGTSAQMQRLLEQNEALETREKNLLARIESMEQEFERHLTEKSFIEDRYVKLDAQAPVVN